MRAPFIESMRVWASTMHVYQSDISHAFMKNIIKKSNTNVVEKCVNGSCCSIIIVITKLCGKENDFGSLLS